MGKKVCLFVVSNSFYNNFYIYDVVKLIIIFCRIKFWMFRLKLDILEVDLMLFSL